MWIARASTRRLAINWALVEHLCGAGELSARVGAGPVTSSPRLWRDRDRLRRSERRTGRPPAHRPAGAAPVRLQVPILGADAPITTVAVASDGELGVPDDPAILGRWRGGAVARWRVAGSAQGTVVLDGHVDTRLQGAGALLHLAALRPGDPLTPLPYDQPRRGVAGHRPRHDLLPLSLMIWGVLSPWSAGANDR